MYSPQQIAARSAGTLASFLLVFVMVSESFAFQDTVFDDDVIVQGSLAVGFDAVNGESFGEDTIRLKENNLRIRFLDTSSSGSFPTNDWRIVVNDAQDGGEDYFRIEDSTNGRNAFTIFAESPSNALNVASGGVGIGTSNPAVPLHVLVDGISSSFTNATIRTEVTNDVSAQDRVMLDLRNNGAVVMNLLDTSAAGAMPFQIRSASGRFSIQQFGGNRAGMAIFDDGAIRYVANGVPNLTVTSNGNLNVIGQAGGGNLNVLGPAGGAGNLFVKGNIVYNGTLSGPSDRNIKENFVQIDPEQVLKKVVDLPITRWNYIADANDTPHLGPMAQDFYSAFKLGDDKKRIPLMDNTGVALAAIQGLNQVVEAKGQQIDELKKDLQHQAELIAESSELIGELTQRLERLEASVVQPSK